MFSPSCCGYVPKATPARGRFRLRPKFRTACADIARERERESGRDLTADLSLIELKFRDHLMLPIPVDTNRKAWGLAAHRFSRAPSFVYSTGPFAVSAFFASLVSEKLVHFNRGQDNCLQGDHVCACLSNSLWLAFKRTPGFVPISP